MSTTEDESGLSNKEFADALRLSAKALLPTTKPMKSKHFALKSREMTDTGKPACEELLILRQARYDAVEEISKLGERAYLARSVLNGRIAIVTRMEETLMRIEAGHKYEKYGLDVELVEGVPTIVAAVPYK